MDTTQPTQAQQDVLDFIAGFADLHGWAPTVAEMAAEFGISANAINQRLKGLERKGLVRRKPGAARAISILG